jgi:hypothetical protein
MMRVGNTSWFVDKAESGERKMGTMTRMTLLGGKALRERVAQAILFDCV